MVKRKTGSDIEIILNSGKFRWHEASIFTTAITLSSLRTWQSEKLFHLIKIYGTGQEQVMERALSGLILNLHYYNTRLLLYPELTSGIMRDELNHQVPGTLQNYSSADYKIPGN